MVKVSGINCLGKFQRVAGAVDIDGNLACLIGLQVIDRRQVVKVGNLTLEFFDVFGADTEFFAGQVAMHRNCPGRAHPPVVTQRRNLAGAFLADQEINFCTLSFQQLFDQAFTDEACGSGDEIRHCTFPFGLDK